MGEVSPGELHEAASGTPGHPARDPRMRQRPAQQPIAPLRAGQAAARRVHNRAPRECLTLDDPMRGYRPVMRRAGSRRGRDPHFPAPAAWSAV